mmetsp:Transcript_20246/g.41378  ORF Transcript_20246/g.41378 Transcript_20246/m.41378 type:complete len:239 (-) Transcript_20246:447-1163(-)
MDELAQRLLRHVGLLEIERESALWLGQRSLLVERCHVLARERILHRATLGWVEDEHGGEQVQALRRGRREDIAPRPARLGGQRAQEVDSLGVGDGREVLLGGRPQHVDDQPQLVQVVTPGEERLAPDHLCEDATDSPHVDGRRVVLVLHEQLRCSVPACHHVFCEAHVLGLHVGVDRPRQSKVTDLQVAILVDEQVARLKVAVEHMCRMECMHASQDLIEKVLKVLVGERLLAVDDIV